MTGAKTYLGDAVYADIENGMIKLTAENGIRATDTIYLEPHVFNALVKWASTSLVVDLNEVASGYRLQR